MAAVAERTSAIPDGLSAATPAKGDENVRSIPPPQVHTPPTTDEASHQDDDAASSSSLSDLGDDLDDEEEEELANRLRFEDAARAGAEAEQFTDVKPDRYENGVPIFTPTMDQFKDFQSYVKGVDPFGMQSGIVLIDPPEEWKRARKALDEMVKHIKIKNPITQEFHGAQGIYTQRNMEKMRSYNLPQWKGVCEQTENQPPARRGEKRLNADKLLGRGSTKNRVTGSSPAPDMPKRGRGRPVKREPIDPDSTLAAPPTPTSPDAKSVVPDGDNPDPEAGDNTPQPPGKGKQGRKPGRPLGRTKGRQPKGAKKDHGSGGAETTVAARRLRNAREANDEVDEEAFQNFDYRVYDNDQWTAERCEELEEKYWKSLNFSNPMYAADMPGSLFDEDTKEWNVAKLPNLLDLLGQPIPGVNTAYLYLGMWRATFAWHLEDVDLYSINYIHFGAPKQWYSISQKDAPKFEAAMKSLWGSDAKNCDQFLRHKTYLVSPSILKSKFGVTVNRVVHREGQFVITFPIGYHSGYNLGYNCAESVNFAIENWLQYGKTARKCQCEADSVFIDVDWFLRKMRGEPSPEYEEVEVTDDDEDDDPLDLPTPPSSDRGKIKVPQKRKRSTKDVGSNKRGKKLIKIRKVSKHQPCCLCPNDFVWEEVLPTTHGQRAHRTCAMYTPETYIAKKDGKDMVFNVENISKARLELKCYECRQKKGSCFQCSSAKCAKSYHATCAMQAGVQVDKGEIAVWHEGVEYRDIGFDWRCRLHRTVKRSRVTSELSACNHANSCWRNPEFRDFLYGLRPGDLIQFQATHSDDIEAGLVVAEYDAGQGSLLVKLVPGVTVIKEVDPTSILFVDSATSCLQKPSAGALELPETLQGKTASLPESTEKKPSAGDQFTEEPRREWAEFVSVEPPANKDQKAVDLAKEKQLWLYLGELSSDAKASYTATPEQRTHDPASNFLDQVQPPKPTMAPPPQPKRQSLAASYPGANGAASHATQAIPKQRPVESSPGPAPSNSHSQSPAPVKASHFHDFVAGQEAKSNQQARILQRQQAKAQQLDALERSESGIGIDHSAVERQRQFQQQASQHARHMKEWSKDPSLLPLTQSESMSLFHPMDPPLLRLGSEAATNSAFAPLRTPLGHDWMDSGLAHETTALGRGLSPAAGMQLAHISQSNAPVGATYSPFAPPSTLPSTSHTRSRPPYPGNLDGPSSCVESMRPSPLPTSEIERRHRISNPAYPFKRPDQILAQKDAEKQASAGSRSASFSSFTQHSPVTQPAPYLHSNSTAGSIQPLDPDNPPQFINPNATQISPPRSSAGPRSTRASFSGVSTHPNFGATMPMLRKSLSVDLTLSMASLSSRSAPANNYIPEWPPYGPLSKPHGPEPQRLPPTDRPLLAQPSPILLASLEKRAIGPNGLLLNDHEVPSSLRDWQGRGGFWGRVADYYIHKHQAMATVYKSPFATIAQKSREQSLAERFYGRLEPEQQAEIDAYRTGR